MLLREAFRFSRRRQTWALRVGFSIAVLAVVTVLWGGLSMTDPDPSKYAEYGRYTFYSFAAMQFVLAGLLAPMLTALGVIEERDEQTLELLALSRLTAGQILWGKVASRLLVLLTVILGTAPILAMVMGLGGVAVFEVVNAVAMTLLVAVVLGAIGGFLALFSRNAVAPVLLCTVWLFGSTVVLPAIYAGLAQSAGYGTPDILMAHFSPPVALAMNDANGLVPLVSWMPVLLMVGVLGVPAFRLATGEGNWVGSREHRTLDRLAVATILGAMLVMVSALPVAVVTGSPSSPAWAARALPAVWAVLGLVTWTGVFLQTSMQLLRDAGRRRTAVTAGVMRTATKSGRRVWSNPVLWRGVVTKTHGPTVGVQALFMLGWLGLAALFAFDGDLFDPQVNTFLLVVSLVPTVVFAAMAATGTMLEERRAGTMDLLAVTTYPAWRIVVGKLGGVAARSLPMLLPGLFMLLTLPTTQWEPWTYYYGEDTHTHAPFHVLVAAFPGMRNLATALWLGSLWTAVSLACLLVGTLINPPRLAWAVNMLLVAGLFFVPPFLLVFEELVEGSSMLTVLMFPLWSDAWQCGLQGVPLEIPLSTCIYTAISMYLFGLLVARIRET